MHPAALMAISGIEIIYIKFRLAYKVLNQTSCRTISLALAIRDNDLEMLNVLHAREIPLLYTINPIQHWTLNNKQLPSSSNIEQMIDSIATSDNTAISYFFEEFETEAELNSLRSTFVFPYAGQILDSLSAAKGHSKVSSF